MPIHIGLKKWWVQQFLTAPVHRYWVDILQVCVQLYNNCNTIYKSSKYLCSMVYKLMTAKQKENKMPTWCLVIFLHEVWSCRIKIARPLENIQSMSHESFRENCYAPLTLRHSFPARESISATWPEATAMTTADRVLQSETSSMYYISLFYYQQFI